MGKLAVAKVSPEEKRWRAESDADTVIRAQEIMNDKNRLSAAKRILSERAKASQQALKNVGGKKR